jgi:hypothetical protein
MYHVEWTEADLPSRARLRRASVLATVMAAIIAVTVVLPAEYGVDPTGAGRWTGLTEMGEIKMELAREAELDRALERQRPVDDRRSSLFGIMVAEFLIRPAYAQAATPRNKAEMTVTLKPNQGAEIKLVMKRGETATYTWSSEGGGVNYDMHGEPDNRPSATHSYKRGQGAASDSGTLEARFDGNHGWFWRNRTNRDVTLTIRAEGAFLEMKRVL